jgi:hypothetical protein
MSRDAKRTNERGFQGIVANDSETGSRNRFKVAERFSLVKPLPPRSRSVIVSSTAAQTPVHAGETERLGATRDMKREAQI